jgi:crotonobetainyl-CoA:carnitine CoA-transferase CaiB-like acyl-CoA transferase
MMSGLAPVKSQDELLGVDANVDIATFGTLPPEEREAITDMRNQAYLSAKRDELVASFQENNHAIEPIVPMGDQLGGSGAAHPQLVANGMVVDIDDPDLGHTTQVGLPIHLASTPGAVKGPRPRPGQHNDDIFGELGYSAADIAHSSGGLAGGAA